MAKALLPTPKQQESTTVHCSVTVERIHVQEVAKFLNISETPPREVVLQAFNHVHAEAIDE